MSPEQTAREQTTREPITPEKTTRYIFSGHAIGAAARFNKLEKVLGFNHVVPALGTSVLPAAGGVSRSEVTNYNYEVTVPKRRSLFSVARIESRAEGRETGRERFVTDTEVRIESITFLEKLYIDLIHVHVQAERDGLKNSPQIASSRSQIEGVHLGKTTATIHLNRKVLGKCATTREFSAAVGEHNLPYKELDQGAILSTIVERIDLSDNDHGNIHQFDGRPNVLYWHGFGWIYFGEVIVKGDDRQVTMLRLQMGSDGGGTGTAGDAHSNGSSGSS
jgi:hypothetical protein